MVLFNEAKVLNVTGIILLYGGIGDVVKPSVFIKYLMNGHEAFRHREVCVV